MAFKKLGETSPLTIQKFSSVSSEISGEVLKNFQKFAGELKAIAPKAEDFLYFSTVMMHAAEASAVNDDGTPKLTSSGEEVKVSWDKSGDTWKWVSNDPTIKAYKNSNGDIFPEEELVKAFKKWVGKPLCIDHKSSSVDHVRGFIADTYYDLNLKRVVALCALDKKGFPQLARQVETGVSNCVSMGTAVGKAVCYDCGKVARVEQDFCDHMRRKSCYGEINVDLSPIELSIVVNGADPKATIKSIIASAKTLNNYVDGKAYELRKLADKNFSAQLTFNDNDGTGSGETKNINIYSKSLEELKDGVHKAIEEYQDLNSTIKEANLDQTTTNDLVSDQLLDEPMADKTAQSEDDNKKAIEELKEIQASIVNKLDTLTADLSKLTTFKHEETMSGKEMKKDAYYLGTVEPTPGRRQYEEDKEAAKVRETADDFMYGGYKRSNMGPVDGLYDGDLEKKQLLRRASEEREAARNAAVAKAKEVLNKQAYYNNGDDKDNPGLPTPKKVKYEVSKENLKTKKDVEEYELGKKSLLPYFKDDEKRKELLHRASPQLRSRFIKASKPNGQVDLGKSAWEVFLGDDLILTASVEDITGESSKEAFNDVNSEEMARTLMSKIKEAGADGVKQMFKKAQAAPAPLPEAPAALPEASPEAEVMDTGKSGDPKETVLSLAEKVQDTVSDLLEAARALAGEQAEMGEVGGDLAAAASADAGLYDVRKEINSELTSAMKEAVAELTSAKETLFDIADTYDKVNDANRDAVASIAQDAIAETKTSVAEANEVLRAFIRYAAGTKALEKKAAAQAELNKMAEGDTSTMEHDKNLMELMNEADAKIEDVQDVLEDAEEEKELLDEEVLSDDEFAKQLLGEDDQNAEVKVKKDELKDLGGLPPGSTVQVTAGLESKAERQAARAKLAAEALVFNEALYEAHPAGGTDTQVGDKTNLSHVEDLVETHEVMVDVATSPVRLQKEAETLHQLISNGSVKVEDLDELVSQGLDKAVVDYWRKYYQMILGPEGKKFADELLKEYTKAELETELNEYKVKLARSFELTYDMVSRGLCANSREAISAQVDEVMQYDDKAFESLKKVIARHQPEMQKTAGKMPQVGYLNEVAAEKPASNMYEQLSSLLGSSKTKGMF